MKIAKKVLAVIFVLTLVCAVVYIVSNIFSILSSGDLTSFPWWSAFPFAAIYFGPPLLLECILYGVLLLIEKRKR